jgi:PPOX class probable FMN-dependent enzyme
MPDIVEITTPEELTNLVDVPVPRVANKVRSCLHDVDRAWLAQSPFCLIATSAADGTCDVSPKGDPPGFTLVLDEHTVVVPERPGNRRVDGFRNVLSNPHVGLIYLVPGREDTLRINGRARVVRDAPFFDALTVKGHRPALALLVDVDEVFYHCSKAFRRSHLWQTDSWEPLAAPSRPIIAKAVERQDTDIEELERYYGPNYAPELYA